MPRRAASRHSCCTASPAAARPRFTCTRSSTRCGAASARSCWCRRSDSRRSSSGASASASPRRWRCCTPRSPTPSASPRGGNACPVRRASCSARAPRCSRRSRISGSSSSTRSTTRRSSSTKAAFVTRRAISPSCARNAPARPVVLGSATPSLETLQNVVSGKFTRLSLPRRAGQAMPPRAAVIDLREHAVRAGHLDAGGRGDAAPSRRRRPGAGVHQPPRLFADARLHGLRLDRAVPRLRRAAHGAPRRLAPALPSLRRGRAVAREMPAMRLRRQTRRPGHGARRRDARRSCFPDVPIARLDRDVVRKRGDMEEVVSRIASGEARILVGTQMVTKGHDFPSVTLVVVLNADQGLFSTDFRAPERVAQTIIQVAGRAGRGSKPGEVLIQTEYPDHPLLQEPAQRGLRRFRACRARRAGGGELAAVRARGRAARLGHRTARRPSNSCAPRASSPGAARRQVVRARARGDGQAGRAIPRAVAHRGARPGAAASHAGRVAAARGNAQDAARAALVARRGSARTFLALRGPRVPAGAVRGALGLRVQRLTLDARFDGLQDRRRQRRLACCISPRNGARVGGRHLPIGTRAAGKSRRSGGTQREAAAIIAVARP